MVAILSTISDRDQTALIAFYEHRENPQRICRRLGLPLVYFNELRANVRRSYFERTGTPLVEPAEALSCADASDCPQKVHLPESLPETTAS